MLLDVVGLGCDFGPRWPQLSADALDPALAHLFPPGAGRAPLTGGAPCSLLDVTLDNAH